MQSAATSGEILGAGVLPGESGAQAVGYLEEDHKALISHVEM
jgi:hypothetical protein